MAYRMTPIAMTLSDSHLLFETVLTPIPLVIASNNLIMICLYTHESQSALGL